MRGTDTQAGGYDVFLSSSHAADNQLALAFQRGLERPGARWLRPRAVPAFRDGAGLSAGASLWRAIDRALHRSSWFVDLASLGAARSERVDSELGRWLETNHTNRLPVSLTDGECVGKPKTSTLKGGAARRAAERERQ